MPLMSLARPHSAFFVLFDIFAFSDDSFLRSPSTLKKGRTMTITSHVLAGILAAELLIGGQARLPFSPTPSLQRKAMAKADGIKDIMPFVPVGAIPFSRFLGWTMCLASGLVAVPSTRVYGAPLSASLSVIGWVAQARMGMPYWLPVVNTVLAGVTWLIS